MEDYDEAKNKQMFHPIFVRNYVKKIWLLDPVIMDLEIKHEELLIDIF